MLEIKVKRNEQAKESTKEKKGSAWPWLVGLAGIAGLWYYNKKKKEKQLVLATQATQLQATQLQAQPQTRPTPTKPSLPGSAEARLAGMGINTSLPGAYQAGDRYKGV